MAPTVYTELYYIKGDKYIEGIYTDIIQYMKVRRVLLVLIADNLKGMAE